MHMSREGGTRDSPSCSSDIWSIISSETVCCELSTLLYPIIQISLRKTWTPETGINADAVGQFLNQQLYFDSYNQMLKRRKLKHQQLNDLAVQRLGTSNSKLSVFLLVLSISPSHSLFVCWLNAQHSHSKWIICHSKRIVLGQVMCCSSFVPAWISPLLSSLSQFAPDAPSQFKLELSAGDSVKMQRPPREAAVHVGTSGSTKMRNKQDKLVSFCWVNTNPASDEVMKTLVWRHQWWTLARFYLGVSNDWLVPHSYLFLQGSSYSEHAQWSLFHIWWHKNGTSFLWFPGQELELKVFALRAQGFWRSAFEDRLRAECSSLPSPDFSAELLNSHMTMTLSCFYHCQCRPAEGLQHITV